MKRAIVILLMLAAAATVFAAELALFVGRAEIELDERNTEAARRQAKKDALADALQKAIDQFVPPEEAKLKKKQIERQILRKPALYVVSYSVLDEQTEPAVYRLAIEARIRIDSLKEAVAAIQIAPPSRAQKPPLTVLVFRQFGDGYAYVPDLDNPLRERFELAGQPVASTATAESFLGSPSFVKAVNLEAYGDLTQVATAQGLRLLVMIELRNDTPEDQVEDACDQQAFVKIVDAPAKAMIASLKYRYPSKKACTSLDEIAARDLFAAVTDALAKHGRLDDAGKAEIAIEFIGVRDYAQMLELQALIRNRAYVQQAELDSFEPGGRVRFRVVYGGTIKQLAGDLLSARAATCKLSASGQSGNLIQFNVETR
ncbi:MAG: hypothetical protein P9L99_03075 [Candidatus Lernaella stagnicola]|nr:hypothetical protein [Candidatus Lernaella stagnicola]